MCSFKCKNALFLKKSPNTAEQRSIILHLFEIHSLQFGTFTLKSGITSIVYIDLCLTSPNPDLLRPQEVHSEMTLRNHSLQTKNLRRVENRSPESFSEEIFTDVFRFHRFCHTPQKIDKNGKVHCKSRRTSEITK